MKGRPLALAMVPAIAIGAGCPSGKTNASTITPVQTEAKTESKAKTDTPKEAEGSMKPMTIGAANCALLEQGYEAFWNGVKAGFEVEGPNITVEWMAAPCGEIVNQAINVTGSDDRINMIFDEIGWVPGLADVRLTVPVAGVLPADYLVDFYPTILDFFNIGDRPYGLPMYVSPYVLYYNMELLKRTGLDPTAPPTAYDEMLEYAEKLSKPEDFSGNPVYTFGRTAASVPASGPSINGMTLNLGGTLLADDGTLSADSQGFKDTITMLRTLDRKGYNLQNMKLKDSKSLFTLGRLAIYCDQSWGFNRIQSINPNAKSFTTSTEPLSGGAGKGQSILWVHCLIYTDNGDAQRETCSKLAWYLVTSEVLNGYFTNTTPAYLAKKDMEGSGNMSPVLAGAAGPAENVTTQVFVPRINNLNLELYTPAQSVTISGKGMSATIANFREAAEAILGQ